MGCGASTSAPPDTRAYDAPEPTVSNRDTNKLPAGATPFDPLAEESAVDPGDDIGILLNFPGTGTAGRAARSSIIHAGNGGLAGSKAAAKTPLQSVTFGALHERLRGKGAVTLDAFADAVASLLPAPDRPEREVIDALFKAFDTDGNGSLDESEVLAGCQALCGGSEADKLRLTFACFDGDGDGKLTKEEVGALLRGTVGRAVAGLAAAIDFAGAYGSTPSAEDVQAEAGGAATLEADAASGTVVVTLTTAAGPATLRVPAAALSASAPAAAELSLDAFVAALVDAAFSAYDADDSATLERDEFVGFARRNPFLNGWFGGLAEPLGNAAAVARNL